MCVHILAAWVSCMFLGAPPCIEELRFLEPVWWVTRAHSSRKFDQTASLICVGTQLNSKGPTPDGADLIDFV